MEATITLSLKEYEFLKQKADLFDKNSTEIFDGFKTMNIDRAVDLLSHKLKQKQDHIDVLTQMVDSHAIGRHNEIKNTFKMATMEEEIKDLKRMKRPLFTW